MSEIELRTKGEPAFPVSPILNLPSIHSCKDLAKAGYHLFSIGPLHHFGHVDFHIIPRFAEEMKKEVHATYLNFPFPLFDFDSEWNRKLCIIDEAAWAPFVSYMLTVAVLNRESKSFFRVSPMSVSIPDPFSRMEKKLTQLAHLDFFSVSSNRGRLIVKTQNVDVDVVQKGQHYAVDTIELVWDQADPAVVKEAEALLKG